MIVPENIAKSCLSIYGLVIPKGALAKTAGEARNVADRLGGEVVVKALIPIGGRGKAGGIHRCRRPEEAEVFTGELLGKPLLGYPVESVLVEEAIPIEREIYAGVVVNTTNAQIDLIFSFSGGIDVEDIAAQESASIHTMATQPGEFLPVYRMQRWLSQMCDAPLLEPLAFTLANLYRAAADLDATLLEVNPLALSEKGDLILLDCKLEIDDNALARHTMFNKLYESRLNEQEIRARKLALSYVPLDGDIGVLTSGAGLGMMTVDLLKDNGLSAANFLDTGGGISESQVREAMLLILEHPGLAGIIINLYGGINRMLEAANGIVDALKLNVEHRPVVVKIIGNQQEEAWALLETQPDVHVVRVVQTEDAVAKLVELVG
jgi:succinyl-CoA synthetase beta subunit